MEQGIRPIIDGADAEVANELYRRRDEAIFVRQEQVWVGDWTPDLARCHDNVDKWIAAHSGDKAVRGWLILDISGGANFAFYFNAHSVVEQDHTLIDITPSEPPCRFLRHIGTDADFERFKKIARLSYCRSQPSLTDSSDCRGSEFDDRDDTTD